MTWHTRHMMIGGLTVILIVSAASAEFVEFTEKDEWIDAVGDFTTIDFTGFEDNTPIVDQYADLGVTFPGFDVISGETFFLFPNDGWGLQGFDEINVELDQPINYIAMESPGKFAFELYVNDELIHTTQEFGFGSTGPAIFGGLKSDRPFDRLRIIDPNDPAVSLDDLFFGPPIPAPGVLGLFALMGGVCTDADLHEAGDEASLHQPRERAGV